ncbi:putative HTH-type transcriptional regulator YfiR [Oxobacter pfennigii]|uniref:Putative HTH-type transcriptional regulator YfiR n=1 Tax=Oxobacter pfennigii TaxID=36849 RepID=A0A0P8WC58_9CLOT|nr:TetR/AcrR family transcriptional regulator [Oxobacter pfennigii]KPU46329.1 putative HTH-type transcriptional regulator YfiR [Oxobacter pfennigii]
MARPNTNHEKKKLELLDIAEKLFIEKGYEQTSIEDILSASGISKGGFYHYFKSKEDILCSSIERLMDDAVNFLKPAVDNPKLNAVEKFKLFNKQKNKFQSSKLEYAGLLAKLMQSDIFQYKYIVSSSQKIVPLFAEIIKQGVNEEVFHVKHPLETADILIRAIVGVSSSAYYNDYMETSEAQECYMEALQNIVIGALGADKALFM